jgi:hypothetical protein
MTSLQTEILCRSASSKNFGAAAVCTLGVDGGEQLFYFFCTD